MRPSSVEAHLASTKGRRRSPRSKNFSFCRAARPRPFGAAAHDGDPGPREPPPLPRRRPAGWDRRSRRPRGRCPPRGSPRCTEAFARRGCTARASRRGRRPAARPPACESASDLRVRAARPPVKALAHDAPAAHDDRADHRIGGDAVATPLGELQGAVEEAQVDRRARLVVSSAGPSRTARRRTARGRPSPPRPRRRGPAGRSSR